MKITEINKVIMGEVELPKSSRINDITDYSDEIKKVIEAAQGLYDKEHFEQTRSHIEFYEANPLLNAFISDLKSPAEAKIFKKEFFYSILCGTYIPGVPSELTAILLLTRRECETPNQMIASLDKSRMKKYLTQQFHPNNKIIKEIIDIVWGYEVNLVTDIRPMVTNNNIVEVYIENINNILLCSPFIRTVLTDSEDIKGLVYTKDKGVVLGTSGIPLRTMIHSFGIVKNDLDLRSVFLADEA